MSTSRIKQRRGCRTFSRKSRDRAAVQTLSAETRGRVGGDGRADDPVWVIPEDVRPVSRQITSLKSSGSLFRPCAANAIPS
jgi:hypothetical protein